MKAIKTLFVVIAIAAAGSANAAIIATYDFINTGTIYGVTFGTINETGSAVLDDIGGGQAIMTIDKEGVNDTVSAGSFSFTSRLVYQGTLSGGIFTVVSGQSTNLTCMPGTSPCPPSSAPILQLGVTTPLSVTPSAGDGGGLPLTVTSSGIVYDNIFHVTDATEHMLTRVWSYDHQLRMDSRMTFTNTTVPVPAAAWLFGSGLLGLTGIARRRKAA